MAELSPPADEEQMEVDQDQMEASTDTAVVRVDISWPDVDFPEKLSFVLYAALHIMFNKDLQISCEIRSLDVMDTPHSVMVTISPASVLSRLLDLRFAKLTLTELNEMVRVSFSQPGSPFNSRDQKKMPVPASGLVYPSGSKPQDQGAIKKKPQHHQGANGSLSSAGPIGNTQNAGSAHWQSKEDRDEETHTARYSKRPIQEDLMECRVPVCHYSHLSSAYRKEMDDIQEKFGVKFKDAVLVSIEANDQKQKELANQAFTELVQRCCLNFEIVTLPMYNLEPDNLTEMLKKIQKDEESKLELSVSAKGYRLSGPREIVEEFLKRNLPTTAAGASRDKQAAADEEDLCPICLDKFTNKKKLGCSHVFCSSCLDGAVKSMGPQCPVCKEIFGQVVGDQPKGTMTYDVIRARLPGFSKCDTIVINYSIPDGMQTERHPNPGKRFSGTERRAYLPNNREGNEVLELLKRAFAQKLIFTVGVSRTTGLSDTVIWNDIHHKTSQWGGPTGFGYPDHGYLLRVKEELKAKGIK
nr:uncharacterized protein LOC111854035 [Paramormyrops kingsleyae]XP_023687390.1 uncharacterized protein LOC111854035 [Paramormyrops kingsleyae]XP_023687396.1 uncharacterized protein LOC111854035 [Paramormyrops kingsleyae]XP_023687406.1 uncharacterized protein LOC111854035 [Paramormyrops kingsleyae]XP_023687413.1 uncharacterized protein LOC111854035 [Paramormyrops kingsleyae]XP_023687421.1 uncharacterized protein LOC111854035 [Paramormyrops kingsleyae]XP_023687428.1 uncharacterized protein LO